MIRRIATVLGAVGMLLSTLPVMATPAAAAIERCSGPQSVIQGITSRSCILVSTVEGRAETRLVWNLQYPTTVFTVCTTVFRLPVSSQRCVDVTLPAGTGGRSYFSYIGQEPGVQEWYSVSRVSGASVASPHVYDT